MAGLNNPGLTGEVPFDTVIYAAPGVNYSAVPALVQYNIYDAPDPAYVFDRRPTGTVYVGDLQVSN